MEYGRPDSCPGHELWVNGHVVFADDVVDGEVKQRDKTCDSNDGEGLSAQETEDNSCHGRREQGFVDAKELSCAAIHIEGVGYGREETARRNISIVTSLSDVVHT